MNNQSPVKRFNQSLVKRLLPIYNRSLRKGNKKAYIHNQSLNEDLTIFFGLVKGDNEKNLENTIKINFDWNTESWFIYN